MTMVDSMDSLGLVPADALQALEQGLLTKVYVEDARCWS